jgi:hypothetical protein
VEEADEERRADPDELPADEQHLDAPRESHERDPQHEQRVLEEIPVEAVLAVQVAKGERGDDAADRARQDGEPQGQSVDQEVEREHRLAQGEPGAEGEHARPAPRHQIETERDRRGHGHRQRGEARRRADPHLAQRTAQERRHAEHDQEQRGREDRGDDRTAQDGVDAHRTGSSRTKGRCPRLPR